MGLRDILARADKTGSYEFLEPEQRDEAHVIPIPVSLDQRVETLRHLIGHQVDIQAEEHRLKTESDNIANQIHKHRVALAQTMLDLGIPSPLATEQD